MSVILEEKGGLRLASSVIFCTSYLIPTSALGTDHTEHRERLSALQSDLYVAAVRHMADVWDM